MGMGDLSLPTTSYGGRIVKGFYVNRLNKGNLNNEMADIRRYIYKIISHFEVC